MSEYNGWRNYATWRVNLELFDGMTPEDMGLEITDTDDRDSIVEDLARAMEDFAYETVESQASGWALDIANSFLNDVDWQEIAEHMVDDFIAEQE